MLSAVLAIVNPSVCLSQNEWPWMTLSGYFTSKGGFGQHFLNQAFECQKITQPLRFCGVLCIAYQLASLDRHAQLTRCFSAAAELLVKSCIILFAWQVFAIMSRHNVIFTLIFNLFKSMGTKCVVADDAFTGFSNNDRRRCRSVTETSALLCENEWTSRRTFWCNIATGTCLIWAGWLAEIWIHRCVTSFSVRRVT